MSEVDERMAVARGVPLFEGVGEGALRRLVEQARWVRYAPGDVVVREGDRARDMFVVASGRVVVRKGKAGVELGHLPAGEVFGEVALIDARPRSATVAACEMAELMVLSAETFATLGRVEPDAHLRIVTNIARAIADRLRRLNDAVEARALWCNLY